MRAVFVALPACGSVLDFGCGTGWVIAEAQYAPGVEPRRVGIDYCFDPLRQAHRLYGDIGFLCSDGLRLPFRDGAFDVVIGHVSLPYMNTRKAFAEVYRVLAPGGSVFFTFHSFRYWRERLAGSVRNGNFKDIIFMMYVGLNGVLNHLSLPQLQVPWKRQIFETVSTPRGVSRSAKAAGFTMISPEQCGDAIFFSFTARKPAGPKGAILAAPAWSAYCPLAAQAQSRAASYPNPPVS